MERLIHQTVTLKLLSSLVLSFVLLSCSSKNQDKPEKLGFWAYLNRPLEPEEGSAEGISPQSNAATLPPEGVQSTGIWGTPVPEPTLPGVMPLDPNGQPYSLLVDLPEFQEASNAPIAQPAPGKLGFVFSPHTDPPKLVEVTSQSPGSIMLCPFTQKPFMVPGDPTPMEGLLPSVVQSPTSPPPSGSGDASPFRNSPVAAALPPKKSSAQQLAKNGTAALLYGTPIPEKPGFVYSPFSQKSEIVDVSGMKAGTKVFCPYSGKIFLVPENITAKTP